MTQRVTGRDGRGLENGCWQKDQMKVRWVRWTVDGRRMSREVGIVFGSKMDKRGEEQEMLWGRKGVSAGN